MTGLRASLVPLVEAVDALVLPASGGGHLPVRTRLRIALRVAVVAEAGPLRARVEQRLRQAGWAGDAAVVADPSRWAVLEERDAALLELADQMAVDPSDVDGDDVERVRSHGVSGAAIVAAAQVVAYASFRARLDAGLALLSGSDHGGVPARLPALRSMLDAGAEGFPVFVWGSWVEPARVVRREGDGLPPKLTPFYLTLAHEPQILAARTALYDEIMTGDGALDRQDRELVALATSLTTGCEYCASVHGRRQMQLSGDRRTAVALASIGPSGVGTERERALVALGARVALTPPRMGAADVRALQEAGLSSAQIADAVAAAALFAWANRLMLTLGAPVSRRD